MPSPLGHALAGIAIAWTTEAVRRTPTKFPGRRSLAFTCAVLAVFPDFDFIHPPVHRMMTHSILAAVVTGVCAALLARQTDRESVWPIAVACTLAYGSHILCDWLGGDLKAPAGVQLLWPFSDRWFISDWGVFRPTDIGRFFRPRVMAANVMAVLRELLLLGPIVGAALLWRRAAVGTGSRQSRAWRGRDLASEDPPM